MGMMVAQSVAMDPIFACVAKLLNLKLHEFQYLSQNWDGRGKMLFKTLKELDIDLKVQAGLLIEVERVINLCHKNNIKIFWPGHKNYPKGFTGVHRPPLFLTYVGDESLIHRSSLSVVGSREPLVWVEYWLEQELKKTLQETKLVSISGGARGIDQMVHRVSLRSGVPSIAVLPSGLLNLYPKKFKAFESYVEGGQLGVVSEYFPWEPMRKHHFFARNRLISAWSPSLLVVQAGKKSGTMITACHAMDQGRTVCALPGNPMEEAMHGNLQLLFDGAQMVRWSSDLTTLVSY